MFADRQLKKFINEIIDNKNKLPDDKLVWKQLTKCMVRNYGVGIVFEQIDESICELVDERWLENKYPKGFTSEDWVYPKKKSAIKINLKRSRTRKLINDNLKITEVAKNYGIIIKGKKALCPFHEDKEPSLIFYEKTNTFKCYGCSARGGIVELIRRCEKKEDDNKTGG